MTPEELAELHPCLFHITPPDTWSSIKKTGLLSTTTALDIYEINGAERKIIEESIRKQTFILEHPEYEKLTINDNLPLQKGPLKKSLEDGLGVADWCKILNKRVFFWSDEKGMQRLLQARMNKNRRRDVLVLDTLSVASEHPYRIELCAINSGAAMRRAAKRGDTTFSPLEKYDYETWRRLRGKKDRILEITVLGKLPAVEAHILSLRKYDSGTLVGEETFKR
ncbi:MAG: hypothetical protein Mars2KO_31810 [Maribacter sp.]